MENQYDFLVIGSGIAGLIFSLQLAEKGTVAVLTKKQSAESNTNYAQGGIASVTASEDDLESHIKDTLEVGAGLCHEDVVKRVITRGPKVIQELVGFGVEFSKDSEGGFDLGREGGHGKRRVLHAGDFTGKVIEQALLGSIQRHPNIKMFENHFAIDLITTRKIGIEENFPNRCLGAYVLDTDKSKIHTFSGNVTILASGGAGKVYLYTSNPDIATGDGIAMAWRAGARVANLEFVQFHPTCLFHPKAKNFLLSEALRGESGALRLINGETFMEKYDRRQELAPRDTVARAIDSELKKRGEDHVLLDMTHIPSDYLLERFPNICARVKEFGFDITKEPIPVVPAAHYMCGGVMIDEKGETSIQNLFACGEVTFPEAQAVGGPTLGADPLGTAVAVISQGKGFPINAFIVRKEPKGHGTMNWIEGARHLKNGMRVVLLEDVITTGGSLLKAAEKIKEAGLVPLGVIVLVDREEGGREALEAAGLKVFSLFNKSDLVA